jgi:hypothetical protein
MPHLETDFLPEHAQGGSIFPQMSRILVSEITLTLLPRGGLGVRGLPRRWGRLRWLCLLGVGFFDPMSAFTLLDHLTSRRHLRRPHRLPKILRRRIPNLFQEMKTTLR